MTFILWVNGAFLERKTGSYSVICMFREGVSHVCACKISFPTGFTMDANHIQMGRHAFLLYRIDDSTTAGI